jgi:hypothetical protein
MDSKQEHKIPVEQILYGDVVYWVTIGAAIICMIGPLLSMVSADNNVLNPHYLFAAIFAGSDPETIWNEVGNGFPGGHFWYKYPTSGDGFTQFGLVLGCSVALWALLAAAVAYLRKRILLYTLLALWVATMVALSTVGLMEAH